MIVAFSGKMHSGKDECARMWQYCTTKHRHSYQYEDFINPEIFPDPGANLGSVWEQVGFADDVKRIASMITGIPLDLIFTNDIKYKYLDKNWNITTAEFGPEVEMTVRELFIRIGNNSRNNIHPNIWVNSLFNRYKQIGSPLVVMAKGLPVMYPDWLITDLRYPNELERIKSVGGYTIRIERPLNLRFPELYNEYVNHRNSNQWGFLTWISKMNLPLYYNIINESEVSLDNTVFDYTIHNQGTIQDLLAAVNDVVKSIRNEEYKINPTNI